MKIKESKDEIKLKNIMKGKNKDPEVIRMYRKIEELEGLVPVYKGIKNTRKLEKIKKKLRKKYKKLREYILDTYETKPATYEEEQVAKYGFMFVK